MKKYILLGGLLLLSLSACGTERPAERAKVGQIGAENSVSREMAAKTIALAFYTNQELDEMETKLNFSDLSAAKARNSRPYGEGRRFPVLHLSSAGGFNALGGTGIDGQACARL